MMVTRTKNEIILKRDYYYIRHRMSWVEDPGASHFRGLNLQMLKVDQAYLNITATNPSALPLYLYSLSKECVSCPFLLVKKLAYDTIITISTKQKITWRIYRSGDSQYIPVNDSRLLFCEVDPQDLGEFGVYDLVVENGSCSLTVAKQPVDIYLPLLLIVCALVLVAGLYNALSMFNTRYFEDKTSVSADKNEEEVSAKRPRVNAIDTFRGISIVLMIFVNDGAGHYWFLEHASWDGLHAADFVFPWFMWIMGVCIPLSIKHQLKRKVPRRTQLLAAFRRACMLFLLGLALNTALKVSPMALSRMRICGVLQRFAGVYLFVATLNILLTFSTTNETFMYGPLEAVQDILLLAPQWLVVSAVGAVHWYIVYHLPVPGCPTGYVGPGGLHESGVFKNCTGGAAGYIDRTILGTNHMDQQITSLVYRSTLFDPEGILGFLPSIVQVFLGVQAGVTLVQYPNWHSRAKRWIIWGVITGVAGVILSFGASIPINKNLWSLSYVLVTSSTAFILLTVCYILVDCLGYWTGIPFLHPGKNATILYVGHNICGIMFPWHWALGSMNTHLMLTLEALWGTTLWVLIAYWLYERHFFLSL